MNEETVYVIFSGNLAFGTRCAFGIAVEMILATRISLEEICRKQIGTFSSPNQEQASFSLAVPGPLVGGRAFLLGAARVQRFQALQLPPAVSISSCLP